MGTHGSRSHRALVEFSIELRHRPSFRAAIDELRTKWGEWGVDALGDDWPSEDAVPPGFPFPSKVKAHPLGQRGGKSIEFQKDLGELILRFVDLDLFPPLLKQYSDRSRPEAVALQHPLRRFMAYCVLYDIDALPAAAGIGSPGFYVVLPPPQYSHLKHAAPYPGWNVIAFLRGSTKAEVMELVDDAFESESIKLPELEPAPHRRLIDIERTYETWRLRVGGSTPGEVRRMLVESGLDEASLAATTVSERYAAAVRDWSLPEARDRPDDASG